MKKCVFFVFNSVELIFTPTKFLFCKTIIYPYQIFVLLSKKCFMFVLMKEDRSDKYAPVYQVNELGENPFLVNLKIPVTSMPVKGQYVKDVDGDLLPAYIDIEGEKMCKIFVSAEKRKKANKLHVRAKELLLWIFYEVEAGDDYFWLNRIRYMAENEIKSITTYRTALKQLIKAGFIHRSAVNTVYWINPALFFSGNRAYRFPDKVVKRKI